MPLAPLGPAPLPAAPSPSPPRPFAAALAARQAAVPRAPAAPAPHPAVAALQGIERAQARLDGVLAAARTGRTFSAGELLALQAEAYRCTQTVDLAARLVGEGAQAVKQSLNTPL